MFFMGSLYLQLVQGYDALQIGLAFLPICIIMGVLTGRYSEPLIMRFGARTLLFPGLTLVAAGLMLFTRAPVDANYWTDVFPVLVLMGTGIGVCFPALMTIAMSGATRADAGLASGLVNTSAQVGGALGLAVLATLSTSRSNALEDAGHSTASALTSGYHLAFWIAAGLVIAAIGVAAVVTPARGEGRRAVRRTTSCRARCRRPRRPRTPRPPSWTRRFSARSRTTARSTSRQRAATAASRGESRSGSYRYDGRTFLSGSPGTRDWYANLLVNPEFTFHLKGSAQADLPAVARPITDEAERREVIAGILEDLGRGYGDLEEWVARSPLAEVDFR